MHKAAILLTIICIVFVASADLHAQDRENIEQVGRLYNFWDTASDIIIDGDIAFIADGRAGVKIINIANRGNIVEIADFQLCDNATKLRRDGDILYVLDYRFGMHLIDISDVENPRSINYFSIGAYDFDISEEFLYIAASDLFVIHKADPENLIEVSTLEVDWTLTQVTVRNDFAYSVMINFGEGGSRGCLIDIADPENPEMVDDEFGFYSRTVFRENIGFSSTRGLNIYDFENPVAPELISSVRDDSFNLETFLGENNVFTAGESFAVYDVGNIENPQLISEIDVPGVGHGLAMRNNTAFVIDSEFFFYRMECRDDVVIIDCENLEEPQITSTYGATGLIHDVEVSDGYAYLACMQDGLKIIDVSNPESPEELETVELDDRAFAVDKTGDLLYVAEGEVGLRIFSIEDPINIEELGSIDTPGRAQDVVVEGDFAYVADGIEGLRIIDISNPANPLETGSVAIQADTWCVDVEEDIAYLGGYHQNMYLIDISDPENPELISSVWSPGHPLGIAVRDGFAYTANWCNELGGNVSGLRIFNVEDPENPELIFQELTEGQSHDIVLAGDYAYITDGERGLKVFDISDLDNIEQVGSYNTPGMACRMTMNEGLIYLADQTNLGIYIPTFDNEAPQVIAEIEDVELNEDPEPRHVVIADLDDIIIDPDGNFGLEFSVQGAPDEANMFIDNNHVLSVTPNDNINIPDGCQVTISAEDIGGLTVETEFNLTINPVNDAPDLFQLLEPADESQVFCQDTVLFSWADSFDPDDGEEVLYWFSLDCEDLGISISYQIPEDSTSITISLDTLNGGCMTVETFWWVTAISGIDSTECERRFSMEVEGTGDVDLENRPVYQFGIASIYPNPFNARTTIKYTVPSIRIVSLQVFDINGRLGETLVDEIKPAGMHRVEWDGGEVGAGVYFVRMTDEGERINEIRKVVLIK